MRWPIHLDRFLKARGRARGDPSLVYPGSRETSWNVPKALMTVGGAAVLGGVLLRIPWLIAVGAGGAGLGLVVALLQAALAIWRDR